MITLGDLTRNADFKMTLALDMAKGAYQNHYKSLAYPRFTVIKSGGPAGLDRRYCTSYYVDGVECADLEAVLVRLNTPIRAVEED